MINNKNVLIVDDDKLMCWGIGNIVSVYGLSATSVNSGREAISEIAHTPFRLVFLDAHLPDANGLELLKEIKRISPDAQVAVMTGDSADGVRQQALKDGAFHFMRKPFGVSEIKGILRCFFELYPDKKKYETHSSQLRPRFTVSEDESKTGRTIEGILPLPWIAEQALMAVTEPLNVLDREYRIVWVNNARAELHQLSVDEMMGKICYEVFQRQSVPCHGCPVAETRETGNPCTRERSVRRPDGTWVWTETSTWPISDYQGKIAYVVEFAHNITGRKLAEESMNAMNSFQRSVIDGLPNPVMVIGTDYRITLMNRAARESFLLDAAPAEPLFCYAVSHNRDMPCSDHEHPCPLEQVRKSGKPVAVVHKHYLPTGEKRIFEVLASPLQGPDGGLLGVIESTRDITERTAYECEIEFLNAETARHLKHLTALRSIDMAISSSLDLRVTLDVFLDQVTSNLCVDAAAVLLYNEHTQTLEYHASRGFLTRTIYRTRLPLGEGYAGQAALERRTISIPDLRAANAFETLRAAGEEFVVYYAVPLISKGHVKGVLEVFHRRPLSPEQEWLDFLEALALQASIAIENAALFDNLHRSNVELSLAYNVTREGWARALDMRDEITEGHTQRVARMTTQIGRAMGMRDDELVHAHRGALLHDIGKLCIPDSILFKKGPLDDEEWKVMRRHPVSAYDLLSTVPYLRPALDIPYCHHEKWDGTGYPNGLKGEAIPLSARIFTLVDVWDALRSKRPYRDAMPEEEVYKHICRHASIHFDPKVVKTFLDLKMGNSCL